MKRVIVYGLARPGEEPRYIGQTVNGRRRLHTHRHAANRGSELPVHRWMRKHHDVDMVVLIDNAVWNDDELRMITQAISQGSELLNCTTGGEGRLGSLQTAASKAKIASSLHKLTDKDRARICELKAYGLRYRDIAAEFGVSHNTVRNVIVGRTYT